MHPETVKFGKLFGSLYGFKVCTAVHYIGGYIRYNESKCDKLKYCTERWKRNICTVSKTTGKYPHESYYTVVRTI